jgi:hypothetical protein
VNEGVALKVSTSSNRPMEDGQKFDLDGVALRLRVNPRARRISIRLDPRTGDAVATAPSARRLGEAVAFARSRRGWLAERMAARVEEPRLRPGDSISLFGVAQTLQPDGRRPRLGPGVITGCGDGQVDTQLVIRAVRDAALEFFRNRASAHCARLNAREPTISLSDARTRWGSCTPAGRNRAAAVRLSWRLALTPFKVADYVVAHECAHLLQPNHGPAFWALVHGLVGETSQERAFLRREGLRLHGFGRMQPGAT